MQKIEKDLKNLEQLFDLLIGHYEGEYEHKKRSRHKLRSKSGNKSLYTGMEGNNTFMEDYSFAEKDRSFVSQSKLLKPQQLNKSIIKEQ